MTAAPQAQAQARGDSEILPVWNRASGHVEAFLVLEPVVGSTAKPFSREALDAAFGTVASNRLGLVCGGRNGRQSISSLPGNCLIAAVDGRNRGGPAGTSTTRSAIRVGMGIAQREETLPNWLFPGASGPRLSGNALTVVGEKALGREATISVGGTLARARLVPSTWAAAQDRWDTRSLSVGASIGPFSANVVGRVTDAPSSRWGGLDLGFSWRMPWKGQLSVGAENVVARGRNPFARSEDSDADGTVPYVRYQQDL